MPANIGDCAYTRFGSQPYDGYISELCHKDLSHLSLSELRRQLLIPIRLADASARAEIDQPVPQRSIRPSSNLRAAIEQHFGDGTGNVLEKEGKKHDFLFFHWRSDRSHETAWAASQVVAAQLDGVIGEQMNEDVKRAVEALDKHYSRDDGLFASSWGKRGGHEDTYTDDSIWIGLDLIQAFKLTRDPKYLERAKALIPAIERNMTDDGGVRWQADKSSSDITTCSTAPATKLMLLLYQQTRDPHTLELAEKMDAYLNNQLQDPETQLYFDHKAQNGDIERSFWSYNQGSAIGADIEWFRVTGNDTYLNRANQTAKAALQNLGSNDALWGQPPAFNAIFFRNLLALDAVSPHPEYQQFFETYMNRIEDDAFDPDTGLYTRGNIGSYTKNPSNPLDQGAISQMQRLREIGPENLYYVS